MRYFFAVFVGRIVSFISRVFHIGAGGTWAGEIALHMYPNILKNLSSRLRKGIILVVGTNGKTTTTLMIKTILEGQGLTVAHNASGANLLNGVVSSLLTVLGKKDWGVFEVDENVLPLVLRYIHPNILVLLNLFRDQLDRFGEVDSIAKKWQKALGQLSDTTTIVANADDPLITAICEQVHLKKVYIGLENPSLYRKAMQHATDTIHCPKCGTRLTYGGVYYSHLGKWSCGSCGFTHPNVALSMNDYQSSLEGMYNHYNAINAAAVGELLNIGKENIKEALSNFTPAFGRMETIKTKKQIIRIILSKNPTGFNESLRTVYESKDKGPILLVFNDRIPDGTDVSWIWDVDFEEYTRIPKYYVMGDRAYDMAVRLKYAGIQAIIARDIPKEKFLWILPTYSAMLEMRKKLTGKAIL